MTANWRPTRLDQFIGQDHIKGELEDEILVCREDNHALQHRIFYGPPGLGKTTLGQAVAAEAGVSFHQLVGKETDLQSLSNVLAYLPAEGYESGTRRRNNRAGFVKDRSLVWAPLVILDEGDAVKRDVLQLLHPIMEGPKPDGSPHIFPGVDEQGKPMPFWVPQFTVWITTNYIGNLQRADVALFSRCAQPVEFRPYTVDQLTDIILQFAQQQGWEIETDAAGLIAERSREVPRNATQLLKEAHITLRAAQLKDRHNSGVISEEIVERTFVKKGIDDYGMDEMSRQYLKVLAPTHEKKKKGLDTIADELGTDAKTVEYVIEPYIRKMGLAEKGAGGRWITDKGRQAICVRVHNPASLRAMV